MNRDDFEIALLRHERAKLLEQNIESWKERNLPPDAGHPKHFPFFLLGFLETFFVWKYLTEGIKAPMFFTLIIVGACLLICFLSMSSEGGRWNVIAKKIIGLTFIIFVFGSAIFLLFFFIFSLFF